MRGLGPRDGWGSTIIPDMKFKKKVHKHRIWRKECPPQNSVGEWSRMLHLWWKRDVMSKIDFKKLRY